MAALRNTLIAEVNAARRYLSIGEIPAENLQELLELLKRCFTCSENPWRFTPSIENSNGLLRTPTQNTSMHHL